MCSLQRYHISRESLQPARMITAAGEEEDDAAPDARVADEAADEVVEGELREQSQRQFLLEYQERYHHQQEELQQEAEDFNPM